MKRLTRILLGLLVCSGLGYSLNQFIFSAEATVRQALSNICPPDTSPRDFRILWTRKWSNRMILVYKINCPSQQSRDLLGYQAVVRKGIGWQSVSGDRIGILPQVPPGEIVQYGTTRKHKERDGRPSVVYGEILTPKVAAVEATFDNGKILRDESNDGLFAMALPEAVEVREIRILGNEGQVLQRDNYRQPPIYFDNGGYAVALKPEDAVRYSLMSYDNRYLCHDSYDDPDARVLGDFRILRTIESSLGAFVLYRTICRDATTSINQASLYISFVQPKIDVWRTKARMLPEDDVSYKNENKRRVWQSRYHMSSADYLHTSNSFVNYSYTSSREKPTGPSIVISGRALTSEVTTVEATFSTGKTLRDQVTNGVFFIVLVGHGDICELRIKGANGQVLQRIDRFECDRQSHRMR